MYLYELFSDKDDAPVGDVMQGMRKKVIDILVPLAANGVPYVTIQQLVDKIGEQHSGISIDRNFVYTLLNPDEVRLVKSVEGDRIYLELPTGENSDKQKKRKEDAIKDKEQQKKTTEKQATQQAAKKNKPVKPVPKKDSGPLSGL